MKTLRLQGVNKLARFTYLIIEIVLFEFISHVQYFCGFAWENRGEKQ